MAHTIERNGRAFRISGRFGNFSVYLGKQCLAFGIMTANDAENWIWAHY
jgi:hypothetical protein